MEKQELVTMALKMNSWKALACASLWSQGHAKEQLLQSPNLSLFLHLFRSLSAYLNLLPSLSSCLFVECRKFV